MLEKPHPTRQGKMQDITLQTAMIVIFFYASPWNPEFVAGLERQGSQRNRSFDIPEKQSRGASAILVVRSAESTAETQA
jgi:hypothetical protein